MYIYICELMIIPLFYIMCFEAKKKKINKALFLLLSVTIMSLILGLRSNMVGEDTNHYVDIFLRTRYVTWNEIFENSLKTTWYVDQYGFENKIENGFLIIIKTIQIFSVDPQVFLLVIAFITMGLFAKFINDNSTNVFMSVYILLCDNIYMFSFNGMRQSLALAIGINAYTLLRRKKNIYAALILLVAIYVHNSSMMLLLMIPIMIIKNQSEKNKVLFFKVIFSALCAVPLLLPIFARIVAIISPFYSSYFINNYWKADIGGTTILWVIELLVVFYLFIKRFPLYMTYELSIFVLLYLVIDIIGLRITMFSRIAIFYRAFLIVFFPSAINCIQNKKNRILIKIIIYILFTLAFLSYAKSDARVYKFFLEKNFY